MYRLNTNAQKSTSIKINETNSCRHNTYSNSHVRSTVESYEDIESCAVNSRCSSSIHNISHITEKICDDRE